MSCPQWIKDIMIRKNKIIPIILVILYAILLILYLPDLKFDNSLNRWVTEDSQETINYKEFLEKFGSDAFLVVAFEIPDKFYELQIEKSLDAFITNIRNLPSINKILKWPAPFFRTKKTMADNIQCFLITFSPPSHLNPNRPELLSKIKELMESLPFKWHLAGTGVIYEAINIQTKNSIKIFLTIGIVILLSLLLIILRKPIALFLSFSVSVFGVLGMLLIAAIFGIPLSIANAILPVIVLFYGTSISIHILCHGGNFKKVLVPCLMATFTTITGFIVFLVEPIPLLHDFAILGVSGILSGLIWAFILFYLGDYSYKTSIRLQCIFKKTTIPSNFYIIFIFLLVIILMLPGVIKLKTDIYSLSALPAANKAVKDHLFIEKNIGNYFPIEYVINTDKADPVNVDDWIYSVYNLEKIDGNISYLSFPAYIDAQQYGYKDKSGKMGRITFLAPLLSTFHGRALIDKIDSIGNSYFEDNHPKITGFVTLYGILAEKLGKSFLYTLFLAFLAVFTIIFIYLRDAKLFIASVFPNIFPIVTILGLMGWLNIPLDMVTVPIGCLLLSIVVDDTLHFIFWYKQTADIRETYKEAGPGIIYTSVILVTGFSVFLISSSPPIRNFGILSITAMLSALCGDLILLPIILKLIKNDNSRMIKENMK